MVHRCLGRTGWRVSPIGFGAFKIGRNEGIKYPTGYDLPDERSVSELLNGILDLGINLIDTAPAYGLSEERIGEALSRRRHEFVLSTKTGETFEQGRSRYDFSPAAIRRSVQRSLRRLQTDVIDLLLLHSHGDDLDVLDGSGAVETLIELRQAGLLRAIGFSGKTVEGARAALAWADVLMVEYNAHDRSHEPVIEEAARADVGIVVKKGLASGTIEPRVAIPEVLSNPHVASLVVGGLRLDHMAENLQIADAAEPRREGEEEPQRHPDP